MLRNATAYWSITNMKITQDMDVRPLDTIRADAVKTQTRQLIRSDNAWITEVPLPAKEAQLSMDDVLLPVNAPALPAKGTLPRANDVQLPMNQ